MKFLTTSNKGDTLKTTVEFKNLEGLDHIRKYVEEAVNKNLGRFESWRRFDVHVILGTCRGRSETHRPIFESEFCIRGKGINRTIFVKKSSTDLYLAISECIRVSEKAFRRLSKIRVTERRHPEAPNLSEASAET